MGEKDSQRPGRTKRHARRKPSVTNVNIFAMAPPAPGPADEPLAAPPKRDEPDDPFFSSEALERRAKRLEAIEQELRERAEDLERREADLEAREARAEADLFLREDAIEARERELADLDERLRRKETELASYVARVQGDIYRSARTLS